MKHFDTTGKTNNLNNRKKVHKQYNFFLGN